MLETALWKILDAALDPLKQRFMPRTQGVAAEEIRDLRTALREHLTIIRGWAAEISFRDMSVKRSLQETFVDLDLFLGHPASTPGVAAEKHLRVSDLPSVRKHLVILGDPGAGKTTTLKKVAHHTFETASLTHAPLLLLIRLREHTETTSLGMIISRILGTVAKIDPHLEKHRHNLEQQFALDQLERLTFTVLIDGLDEIKPQIREPLVEDLRFFLSASKRTQFIVTCRKGEYHYHFENASVLTILPLSDEQIVEFSDKWLGPVEGDRFRELLRANPYSGSEVRPLTLAHLCAIYERSGSIPERPRTIYRKLVRLFLEDWDEQRSIIRVSRYANFEVDRKEDFLEALAFYLTTHGRSVRFTHSDLELAYLNVYESFGLPRNEMSKVVREVESHTGLILESSYETYEFAHRSIQEFLTASYALKLPQIPKVLTDQFPNESAVVVALSSNPNAFFSVISSRIATQPTAARSHLFRIFLSRLLVERADFTRMSNWGMDLVALVDAVGSIPMPELKETLSVLLEFIDQPSVGESLALALESHFNVVDVIGDRISIETKPSITPSTPHQYILLGKVLRRIHQRYPLLLFPGSSTDARLLLHRR